MSLEVVVELKVTLPFGSLFGVQFESFEGIRFGHLNSFDSNLSNSSVSKDKDREREREREFKISV